ncbi:MULTISPECIES: type II toxin-antitoxin system TacA family antitoxin [unclassified Tolypothrix]|uniref:type II toxin-antitoxin system TacA family antitoxin n=1 Tax=unclassified Tolypothrix TaxID=2649714 RepID=UPI0005EAB69C|nr:MULTISPECIES: DUF1778 domain-containing protein [unclassified Tolypothrix]BAY90566.1 hypothetical protein NIES3275_25830 [Microchaete diplosiphon NIES-3275]EKF01292.1 toxin-antitoxin system protein [Tolypothrix sp. PCC 7601]MBE9087679.1 DUF1778 domain-containing protein [Tolypothrix sp. LEGE 11397]UYD24721.1 DUF1778 domain-containing protein [Tolypothrix sp. PCC 7712]UYD33049.1 DUF1778 domain-containing protein [Tolypothrix sp. PCC 7601]
MSNLFEPRTERIDIRTSAIVKKMLQQAAAASHKNVSEFLLEHGLIAAQEALTNRKLFVLDDEQWQAFQDALDSPSTEKPRLRRLLTEPSVFE